MMIMMENGDVIIIYAYFMRLMENEFIVIHFLVQINDLCYGVLLSYMYKVIYNIFKLKTEFIVLFFATCTKKFYGIRSNLQNH